MIGLFKKHYWLLLLLVVAISYGQLLFMFPWQDDHTLFFKLQHINENAGFFGYGPLGQGAYKYIVTPYILIYKIFGPNVVAFFVFAALFYFFASLVVYKVFFSVVGEKGGRVAGFLFAAGFVASDGFIRIFNSVPTSISIILASLTFLFYWKFSKKKNYLFYFLALASYFSALEFTRLRAHYLIAVVVFFELFFLLKKPLIRAFVNSAVRLTPFLYVFYFYFLKNADVRAAQMLPFLHSLLTGDFFKLFSS